MTVYWISILWLALGIAFLITDASIVHTYFAFGVSAFFLGVHHIVRAIERTKK